jgi:hypothetical protein
MVIDNIFVEKFQQYSLTCARPSCYSDAMQPTGKGILLHVYDKHGLEKLLEVEIATDKKLNELCSCPWMQMTVLAKALAARAHELGVSIGDASALFAGAQLIMQERDQDRATNAN